MKLKFPTPLVHIYIAIPFISIRAGMMVQRMDQQIIEYVAWEIEVWKWHFTFSLFDTMQRWRARYRK